MPLRMLLHEFPERRCTAVRGHVHVRIGPRLREIGQRLRCIGDADARQRPGSRIIEREFIGLERNQHEPRLAAARRGGIQRVAPRKVGVHELDERQVIGLKRRRR